jgi:hypothetical protein
MCVLLCGVPPSEIDLIIWYNFLIYNNLKGPFEEEFLKNLRLYAYNLWVA